MSFELRRVPLDYKHPKDENGSFVPLFWESDVDGLVKQWIVDNNAWERGFLIEGDKEVPIPEEFKDLPFKEYDRDEVKMEQYLPVHEWGEPDTLGFCMYETCTEGTPASAVYATKEELADALAKDTGILFRYINKESVVGCLSEFPEIKQGSHIIFSDALATKEDWMRMIDDGYACSTMYIISGDKNQVVVHSGVLNPKV